MRRDHIPAIVRAIDGLRESLTARRRARLVNPLIAAMHQLLSRRFRRQAKFAGQRGHLAGFLVPGFAARYADLMQSAWERGADIAGVDLGVDLEPAGIQIRTAADLVREIDATSERQSLSLIRDAVERGLTRDQMLRELGGMFREWASAQAGSRAEGIAVTEIAGAVNRGMVAAARSTGMPVLKEWWADPDACDECLDNVDDPVTLDEPFASGDMEPPAHPNCRCSLRLSVEKDAA